MPGSVLLIVLLPILSIIVVTGLVVTVALCVARPEDVPALLKEYASMIASVVTRIPVVRESDGDDADTDPTLLSTDSDSEDQR